MKGRDSNRDGESMNGTSSFYIEELSLIKGVHASLYPSTHLLTLIAIRPFQLLRHAMNPPQIQCNGCDRVFGPRGLSQHLTKNKLCHARQAALNTPSIFQTTSAGSYILNCSGSIDRCNVHPGVETDSEYCAYTFRRFLC